MKAELETSPDSILMWNGVSLFVLTAPIFYPITSMHGMVYLLTAYLYCNKSNHPCQQTHQFHGIFVGFFKQITIDNNIPQTKIHLIISFLKVILVQLLSTYVPEALAEEVAPLVVRHQEF